MDIEVIRLKSELLALETLVVALTRSLASWQRPRGANWIELVRAAGSLH